jgi:hypothetical protein
MAGLLVALREDGMTETKLREVEAGLYRARIGQERREVTHEDVMALTQLAAAIKRLVPEREVPQIFALAGLAELRVGVEVNWVLVFLKHFLVVASHLMAAPEKSHSWEGRERQAVRGYTQRGSSIRFEGVPGDALCATGFEWLGKHKVLPQLREFPCSDAFPLAARPREGGISLAEAKHIEVVKFVLQFFMDRGALIIREASATATEADLIVLEERQRQYERDHSMEPFSLEHRDVFVPYEGGVVRAHTLELGGGQYEHVVGSQHECMTSRARFVGMSILRLDIFALDLAGRAPSAEQVRSALQALLHKVDWTPESEEALYELWVKELDDPGEKAVEEKLREMGVTRLDVINYIISSRGGGWMDG